MLKRNKKTNLQWHGHFLINLDCGKERPSAMFLIQLILMTDRLSHVICFA